jgi:phosphatidylglycerophosphate synthase
MSGATPVNATGTLPVRRTSEIEEATNARFIHPLSARLVTVFARWGVAPNAVSLTGMAAGLAAGVCYAEGTRPYAVCGFLLMLVWHVMDGADGQLARLTGKFSASGKVLDGICDYVTFIAVYVGICLATHLQFGAWVWALAGLSGVCHALQSAAYELQRQEYDYWGYGRGVRPLKVEPESRAGGKGRGLYRFYIGVQTLLSGQAGAFGAAFDRRLAASPGQESALRSAYRTSFAPIVRRWSILSANYRTFAIFLFAVCGFPLGYFLFETIGLSLVLAGLMLSLRRDQERFILETERPMATHPGVIVAPPLSATRRTGLARQAARGP